MACLWNRMKAMWLEKSDQGDVWWEAKQEQVVWAL